MSISAISESEFKIKIPKKVCDELNNGIGIMVENICGDFETDLFKEIMGTVATLKISLNCPTYEDMFMTEMGIHQEGAIALNYAIQNPTNYLPFFCLIDHSPSRHEQKRSSQERHLRKADRKGNGARTNFNIRRYKFPEKCFQACRTKSEACSEEKEKPHKR